MFGVSLGLKVLLRVCNGFLWVVFRSLYKAVTGF